MQKQTLSTDFAGLIVEAIIICTCVLGREFINNGNNGVSTKLNKVVFAC